MRLTILVITSLAGAVALPASAQILTPQQAIEYALANNPGLRAAQEQSLAAGEIIRAAGSARKPRVTARYTLRHSNNPLDAFADKLNTRSVSAQDFDPDLLNHPDPTTLNMAELGLQMPVYTSGLVNAQVRQAEETGVARRLQYERARQQVAAQAMQAYLAVQAAHRGMALAEDAVDAAQAHANTTARLQRAGRIVASDPLTAEVNLTAIKGLREQALARARQAENQFKLVLGLPLDNDVQVQAWTPPAISANPNLADLENQAVSKRKDLMALASQVSAARAHADATRAENKVRVDLMATTTWYDRGFPTDNNSWAVMGIVSKPLYDGGGSRYRTYAARHEADALQAHMYGLQQSLRGEIRAAFNELQEAQARLALAGDNVDRARRTVELVEKRYGEGRTILIDLLQAERALVEARNEELNAAFALAVSRVELQLAAGEPVDLGGTK